MESKKPTIMVVEDEHLLLKAITGKLKLNSLNVIACKSGAEAWDNFEKLPQPPDAIWLDYYLGDTNGTEFMQKLRKNKKWASIPVVVISNSASQEKIAAMMALGAKNYFIKAEHRLDNLISEIKSLIITKAQENNGR